MKSILRFAFLMLFCLLYCLPDSSAQTNRGVGVPLERLPKDLSDLSPRDYFIPSTKKRVGSIHKLEGNVVVIHGGSREAYFGMKGDPVHEKDVLVTLGQSKCRIRFLDQNVVTMADGTEFSVEGFIDIKEEGRKSSFFRLVKGRAAVYAMRLFRYKDVKFNLATPNYTIGVRGTKFGVHVYFIDDDNKTASLLAQAGARRTITDCFCEEGVLDVDGRAVASGEMLNGRTGQVIPTPPEVIRSFKEATEFKTEGATGKSPDGGKETSSFPKGVTGGGAAGIGEIQDDVSTKTQTQTGRSLEPRPTPTAPAGPSYPSQNH